MKEIIETTVEESNEELSHLKESLRHAVDEGDVQKAEDLKAAILPHLEVVRNELGITPEKAQEMMGGKYFGPEAIEKAYRIKLERKDIPKIPFTKEDLEKAQECGDLLVLRVDKDSDGRPLTMERIEELVSTDGTSAAKKADKWWVKEKLFSHDIPRAGWALISGSLMMATAGEKYLEQTKILASNVLANVFMGRDLPQEYKDAVEELEKKAPILKVRQYVADDNEVSREVAELKINQLLRHTPVEVFYDTFLHYHNKKEDEGALYSFHNIWTNNFLPGKGIVAVGSNGVSCRHAVQDGNHPFFGVISRRS
ncbi:MAG: hypothetical protein Q7S53_05270 [bacterium]|nr:hypothetical protein [bacterium]